MLWPISTPTRTGSSLPSRAASRLLPRRCSPVSATRRSCRRICRVATSISATASPAAHAAAHPLASPSATPSSTRTAHSAATAPSSPGGLTSPTTTSPCSSPSHPPALPGIPSAGACAPRKGRPRWPSGELPAWPKADARRHGSRGGPLQLRDGHPRLDHGSQPIAVRADAEDTVYGGDALAHAGDAKVALGATDCEESDAGPAVGIVRRIPHRTLRPIHRVLRRGLAYHNRRPLGLVIRERGRRRSGCGHRRVRRQYAHAIVGDAHHSLAPFPR